MKEFDEVTMAKVGIDFTPEAVFQWLNYVDELGDKIGKSLRQKRTRYLEGFPESFDTVITAERMCGDEDGTYKVPANYPSHHPKAGQAHPDRGKPDLDAIAIAFYPEWYASLLSVRPTSLSVVSTTLTMTLLLVTRAMLAAPSANPSLRTWAARAGTSCPSMNARAR